LVIHILYACDLLRFRLDVSFFLLAFDGSPQRNCPIIGNNLDVLRIGGKRVVRRNGLSYVLSDRSVGLVLGLISCSLRPLVAISDIAAGVVGLYGG
jgi:hypothetical protein